MSKPGLFDPTLIAKLNCGDWLHVLATTRLGENELHGAHKDRSFLAIDELPPDDALALIESYQPDGRFRSYAERDAACEIVSLLGCFTLAVESAAVYLGQFANDVTCTAFLARLKKEGLEGLDTAASQSSEAVLHGEKRLRATLQPTLERLGAPEKLALEYASLLPPDQVPLPWLRALVATTFPEMERDAEPGYPDPWKNVLRCLFSSRLLTLGNHPEIARIHRMVGTNVVGSRNTIDVDGISKRDALFNRIKSHAEQRYRFLEDLWIRKQNRWEIDVLSSISDSWMEHGIPEGKALLYRAEVMKSNLRRYALAENRLLQILSLAGRYPSTIWELQKFFRFTLEHKIPQKDLIARLTESGVTPVGFELIESALRRRPSDLHLIYIAKDAIIGRILTPIDHLRDDLVREVKTTGRCETWMIRVLGYDDDPRGLYDIPEVRAWCEKAVTVLPYLPVIVDLPTFQWFAFCLVPTEPAGDTGYVTASPIEILELVQRAQESLVQLLREAEIDRAETIADRCMCQILAGSGLPGLDGDER